MKTDRSVLVTGAASGIGLAIAQQFMARNDRVILVDVNPQVLEIAEKWAAGTTRATAFVVDVAEEAQIMHMLEQLRAQQRTCDVLVNCAGVALKKDGGPIPLMELSTADWNRVFQINLTAPFILCRELLPGMKARGFGRVVNIASITGQMYRPRAGIEYAAATAGMLGLTRRLAGEFAPFGITINSVAPGRVQTPLSGSSGSEAHAIAQQSIPMQRGGRTEEIASAVCYLASEEASFITGTCMDVNGGDHMN